MIKILSLRTLLLIGGLLAVTPGFAQTAAPAATEKPAEKAKPLSSADKGFVKDSLETMYFLTALSDRKPKESLKSEEAQTEATKLNADLMKLWPILATMATDNGEKIPGAVSVADKGKMAKLGKVPVEGYDKEWLKLVSKETKHLVTAFGTAAKSLDPQMKTVVADWSAPIKAHNDEIERLEKGGKGKK